MRVLVRMNQMLIRLSTGRFAYQVFFVATPRPFLDGRLNASMKSAGAKAEALSTTLDG